MDIAVEATCEAKIARQASTSVNASTLLDIVKRIPPHSVMLCTVSGTTLTLTAGGGTFSLMTINPDDHPVMSFDGSAASFAMPRADLRRVFADTLFSASTDVTRYYLNGVYLHVISDGDVSVLRAVATDGHKLAQVDVPLPHGANDIPGVIVPRRTAKEMKHFASGGDGDVVVAVTPNKIRFDFGRLSLTSTLVDGTFPDYASVIPRTHKNEVIVGRQEFVAAVSRVSTVDRDGYRAIKLSIGKEQIALSVNNPDAGSATEEIDATLRGSPMEIAFMPRYLIEIASHIDSDALMIRLGKPGEPVLIGGHGDDTAIYVLMPMALR
jgi:DNA polymerase-3 subunit beta